MSSVTVVYNPSVDEEWRLDDLVWDEKNLIKSRRCFGRVEKVSMSPAGSDFSATERDYSWLSADRLESSLGNS